MTYMIYLMILLYKVQEGLKRLGIQTSNDNDETMRAINAVHQQLMEESQLPSMLPEKVHLYFSIYKLYIYVFIFLYIPLFYLYVI